MLKVPTAFVLLNTEIGAEAEVVKALKEVEGVEAAFNLWGVYDIIASVKADSMGKLAHIINKQIEEIAKVHEVSKLLHPTCKKFFASAHSESCNCS